MFTVLIWLTVLLKLPLGGLVWMWWVTRRANSDRADGGGAKVDAEADPLQHPRWPLRPRRGPHADARPPAPPRNRSVIAHARKPADQRWPPARTSPQRAGAWGSCRQPR